MEKNSSAMTVKSEHARVCKTSNVLQTNALFTRKNTQRQCRNIVLGNIT